MICEICFKDVKQTYLSYVHLWIYGNRQFVKRNMCKTCIRLEKKGEL